MSKVTFEPATQGSVVQRSNQSAIRLQLPKQWKIFAIYALSLLMYTVVSPDPNPRGESQLPDPKVADLNPGEGGELPYEEYTGVCHELGSYFQEKIPKRVCKFFTKIPERAIISVRNSR